MTTGQQKKVKGFFWSIDPKHEDGFREKELEIIEAGSRAKAAAAQKAKAVQQGISGTVQTSDSIQQQRMFSSTGAGGPMIPLVKPAMPVPMMAPRMLPGLGPPPSVGMSIPAGPLPPNAPVPMMAPPMVMQPPPAPSLQPQPSTLTSHSPSVPFPATLPDVCLPITVGLPPAGAQVDTAFSSEIPGQPIALHGGGLFLNPAIFSGLTQPQIEELQQLKAAKALEILTDYVKNYVRDKIVKQAKAKARAKTDKGKPGPSPGSEASPALTSQLDAASILALAQLATATSGPHDPATMSYLHQASIPGHSPTSPSTTTLSFPHPPTFYPPLHPTIWTSGATSKTPVLSQPAPVAYPQSGDTIPTQVSDQTHGKGQALSNPSDETLSVDMMKKPEEIVT